MNIFEKRETVQPYEYPQLLDFADAIHGSFWTVDHFTYDRDVRDFKIELTPQEQEVVKRSMLAIGVVENKVKTFWARIDMRMPKTEISDVGHVFAGNEVIHRRTYERLLNLLNLSEEFESVLEIPCMKGRAAYLTKYLKGINSRSDKEFTKSLILFTLLIENASLFSQFLIISYFAKYKNVMKNFSKVVSATGREEMLHGLFGSELINIIKTENPDWFDEDMENKIRRNIRKAFKAECEVLDWIFEMGEPDFMSKENIIEYLKYRFNESLTQIGYEPEFEVDQSKLVDSDFFERGIIATKAFDFFDGKSVDYNENKAMTDEELWED